MITKNKAAVALGRKGGLAAAGKGAAKVWNAMTPDQRSDEMRKRAHKMWLKRKAKAPWSAQLTP